jgi:hypothetical protein
MKVKLLKKVRKRFQITHHPKGLSYSGDVYNFNLFILTDNTNSYYERATQCGFNDLEKTQYCGPSRIFETEKECIDYLKLLIISRLRGEGLRSRKDKIIKSSAIKVWYNQK